MGGSSANNVEKKQLILQKAACKNCTASGEITCFLFQLALETDYFLSSYFKSQKVANGMWAETHSRTYNPLTEGNAHMRLDSQFTVSPLDTLDF